MPITQYFENPTQAGLLLHHKHFISSSTTTKTSSSSQASSYYPTEALKLASNHPLPRHLHPPPRQTAVRNEKRGPQRRVRDVSAQTDKYSADVIGVKQLQNDDVPSLKPRKPVDEDLYKIPPDLIHSSTRKKMPGFLACLVPCSS
ncbi:unnamed protein product [Cochlearia groenlandica]